MLIKMLQRMLMPWATMALVTLISCFSTNKATASLAIAKPNCPNICGNVSVPYPFGIGDPNCAFSSDFLLHCNNTSGFAYLYLGNIPILKFFQDEAAMIISVESGYDCYSYGELVSSHGNIITLGSHNLFTFSYTRNKLVGLGCDTLALISELNSDRATRISCTSFCDGAMNTAKDVNSCSGAGCCQTSIPDGLQSFEIGIGSMSNYSKKLSSICNYALLIDHLDPSLGSILKTNLNHHPANTTIKTHVVVDWVIDNKTCVAASTESSLYACGLNTLCIDYNSGYRCVCKEGFQGNPYLQGCEDINECLSPQIYPCDGSCTNTEGNYACRCPPFMHGDGKLSCKGIRIATLAAGISSGFGLILLFVAFYVLHKYMRKKRQIRCRKIIFKKNGGLLLEQQISSRNEGKLDRARIFTAEELEKATDSYNENRILGRGGQGTVYKGMLTDGTVVAVKKSGKMDQDQSQTVHFINELVILSQINHKHVVKLLGCCLETQVPLIVYEFISNGTLWSHLHDHSEEEFLPLRWSDRLRIAREVAMALAYMHSSASIPIYHRDIKSSNILLDEKLRAKVSDFGISRSVPGEKTHLTTLVQGTFGYLDPEYFQSNQYTDKSDVYSYGVVLVELLTRQKPIPSTIIEGERGLAAEFMSAIEENRLYDVVDPQVLAEGEERELIVVANLAKECLRLNGKRRPTMPDVVLELENLERSQNHLPPKHNSFWNEDYIETSRKWDANSTQNEIRGFMMMSRKELDQLPLLEDDDDDVSNESYQHITT